MPGSSPIRREVGNSSQRPAEIAVRRIFPVCLCRTPGGKVTETFSGLKKSPGMCGNEAGSCWPFRYHLPRGHSAAFLPAAARERPGDQALPFQPRIFLFLKRLRWLAPAQSCAPCRSPALSVGLPGWCMSCFPLTFPLEGALLAIHTLCRRFAFHTGSHNLSQVFSLTKDSNSI